MAIKDKYCHGDIGKFAMLIKKSRAPQTTFAMNLGCHLSLETNYFTIVNKER